MTRKQKTYTIHVKRAHIKHGITQDCKQCPIALAVLSAFVPIFRKDLLVQIINDRCGEEFLNVEISGSNDMSIGIANSDLIIQLNPASDKDGDRIDNFIASFDEGLNETHCELDAVIDELENLVGAEKELIKSRGLKYFTSEHLNVKYRLKRARKELALQKNYQKPFSFKVTLA